MTYDRIRFAVARNECIRKIVGRVIEIVSLRRVELKKQKQKTLVV